MQGSCDALISSGSLAAQSTSFVGDADVVEQPFVQVERVPEGIPRVSLLSADPACFAVFLQQVPDQCYAAGEYR